jgi:hypothetical protein
MHLTWRVFNHLSLSAAYEGLLFDYFLFFPKEYDEQARRIYEKYLYIQYLNLIEDIIEESG